MFITNFIGGKELGQLEELMERNHGKNGSSTISISSLNYATTYKNGKLSIKVSVKIDRQKISPEEFKELRQIISPKNKPDSESMKIPNKYSGAAY